MTQITDIIYDNRRLAGRLFLAASLLFSICFQAQITKADSLLSLLRGNQQDTNLVKDLNDYAKTIRSQDPDTAIFFAMAAAGIAEKLNYADGLGSAWNTLGLVYRIKGDLVIAKNYLVKVARYKREAKNIKDFSNVLINLGVISMDEANYTQSLKYYTMALELKEIINDRKGMTVIYNNSGLVYEWMGKQPEALQAYLRTLQIAEQAGDSANIAAASHNIGNIYNERGEYETAMRYYLSALKVNSARNNKVWLITNNNSIGSIFFATKKYKEAREKYLESLRLAEELGNLKGEATALNNLGTCLESEENFKEAEAYYQKSLLLRGKINDINGLAIVNNNMSRLYYKLKQYRKSASYATTALQQALSVQGIDVAVDSYKYLAACDSVSGNYTSALNNYKLFIQYRDSISNEENTRKTVQSQMQYEFDKKETAAKIDQEKKDALSAGQLHQQKMQRNYFIVGFVLVLLLGAFILYSLVQKRKANRLLEEKNILIEKQKHAVEEKQKEILDSIYYARRIQRSLLANERYIEKTLRRLTNE